MRRMTSRFALSVVASLVTVLALAACTAPAPAAVATVGALRASDLEVIVLDDGAAVLAATIENASGVDRAFTVRWVDARTPPGRTAERSALVPARSTLTIEPADQFILTGLDLGSADTVVLTVVQGFFPRADDGSIEVVVAVRSSESQ